MTDLTSYQVTDLFTDVLADYYNKILGSILRSQFNNTETITATKELADVDTPFQIITPSGADRTIELAPEATSNHPFFIYNTGTTYNLVVKDDAGTIIFDTLAPDEFGYYVQVQGEGWRKISQPVCEYKLSVTVSSNDLIVALTHLDGNAPSAYRPLCITIAGVKRYVTAATSITLADATNWFNAGSAELATKEIDYFAYAVWDSNSSIVAVSCARIPHGLLVSDFSSTNTNERYLGNYANFTSTDSVVNLGRFAATLSAGAGYTWTVPTFTNLNLIHTPICETRRLSWTPAHSRTGGAYTNAPTVNDTYYQIVSNRMKLYERHTQNGTPGSSGSQTMTLPFSNVFTTAQTVKFINAASGVLQHGLLTGSSNTVTFYKYDGTAEATASQAYIADGDIFN